MDFRKDPYFADLYGAPSLVGEIQNAFAQEQQMRQRDILNQRASRQNSSEQALFDALQGMDAGGDPYATLEQAALNSGDADTFLRIQNVKRQNQYADAQQDSQKFRQLEWLIESGDPVGAMSFYNENLADKYGQRDASMFTPKAKLQIIDGQVVDLNSLSPGDRIAPSSRGKKKTKAETTKTLMSPDGIPREVPKSELNDFYAQGYKPYSSRSTSGSESLAETLSSVREQMNPSSPQKSSSVWDRIFGGSEEVEVKKMPKAIEEKLKGRR